MNDVPTIPAHITLAGDRKPQVLNVHGVYYITAPDAPTATRLWLELLDKEMSS